MAEYDFFATLREELNQIEREADGPGVHDAVRDFAQATGTTEARALAAFWRASKRHGESLEAFATEVREQRERELATRGAHARQQFSCSQAHSSGEASQPEWCPPP
jgi:molybdopterin converting factor small subunit